MKRPKIRFRMYWIFISVAIATFFLAAYVTAYAIFEVSTQYTMAVGFFILGGCAASTFAIQCKKKEEELFPERKLS